MTGADFERARRKADWNRIVAFFTGRPSLLLPFDLVRSQIEVKSIAYAGTREIEIDKVIGSVNRYHDFDREFLPRSRDTGERWKSVRQAFDSPAGFPPIKVYQVGSAYFVVDGNHRLSVARRLGMKRIEAEVTEFRPNVPIDENTDIPALIVKAEYSDFLKRTRLDELRPEQWIEFTRPGRYATLLEHIEKRRYFLGLEASQAVPYEDAVVSWYDGLYRPLIELLHQEGLLERFPKRTEADLYVWITEHLYFLREQWGDEVGLDTATRDFVTGKVSGEPRRRRTGRRRSSPAEDEASALRFLADHLAWMSRRGIGVDAPYHVPARWIEPGAETTPSPSVETTAPEFWRASVDRILDATPRPLLEGNRGEWTRRAVVYNLFVRLSCAYDHDGDGELTVLNASGMRETGTFIKAVAMLPYLRDLGCNAVHLLPICRIGQDGRKGALGSPYAIADPYQLDETLSEPLIGLGPDAEFAAFVEAAHRLGIRVVLEFVFRTAAKDSVWVAQHPEWFYWIREAVPDCGPGVRGDCYGSPAFSARELRTVRRAVERGDFEALIPPPAPYRDLFAPPPLPERVTYVKGSARGAGKGGDIIRIPGEFEDWPPDDPQPPWGDVTYLRLYDAQDFNYIAYNTVRMYDRRLATPAHAVSSLWDRIAGILPYYQNRFHIDGAMIDMGHALPPSLRRRLLEGARGVNPGFAFWGEDFAPSEASRAEGYNAAVGSFWWTIHRPPSLEEAIEKLAEQDLPLPFFATPETHNSPRCAERPGGIVWALSAWTLGAFLPAVPVLHSGFELGATRPVNTGLDFEDAARARYPEEELPLCNPFALPWDVPKSLIEPLRRILEIRASFEDLVTSNAASTIAVPASEHAVAYIRSDGSRVVLVAANPSDCAVTTRIRSPVLRGLELHDPLSEEVVSAPAGALALMLKPWGSRVLVHTPERV
ncbi:MAG: hypothetical protein JSW65_02580 [Candidatus Bipolaricaulota bacterium]|nr:MAG: hypothetical protein JSW65_02580 [Candidatus Bipolaricaulota bacterium]